MRYNFNQIRRLTVLCTTNQVVLEANKNRKAFVILNNGANIVDFFDNSNSRYGQGFPVAPTQRISDDDFDPQGALYAESVTTACELCIWEVISRERETEIFSAIPTDKRGIA